MVAGPLINLSLVCESMRSMHTLCGTPPKDKPPSRCLFVHTKSESCHLSILFLVFGGGMAYGGMLG